MNTPLRWIGTMLLAGAVATFIFDLFGQALSPLAGQARLAPTGLATATLTNVSQWVGLGIGSVEEAETAVTAAEAEVANTRGGAKRRAEQALTLAQARLTAAQAEAAGDTAAFAAAEEEVRSAKRRVDSGYFGRSGWSHFVHFVMVGLIAYPLGWILFARPAWLAVAPGLHWIVPGLVYGVALWVFALYFMAHLIAGNPPFLGFGNITWVALVGHVLFALTVAGIVEARHPAEPSPV
ncbi:MAG: hypothetical protein AAGE18_05700 [Pseudomonadota bacterium]